MSEQQLKVEIKEDLLTISIGTDLLIYALSNAPCCPFKITNKRKFLKMFRNYLLSEQEDGGTPIHIAFDQAANDMFENGEEGMEFIEDEE
jgi:hypothetical protein